MTVNVLPSIHKRLLASDLQINRTVGSASIVFRTIDAYGNNISSISAACSYFAHDRLVYTLRITDSSNELVAHTVTSSFDAVN